MKNKIVLIISLASIALSSCAKKANQPHLNAGTDLKNLPAWVIDPSVKDGIGAVGIANPSKGGIKFQIPKAELDAKANIASIIESEITRVTKESLRSAQVNEDDDVEDFFTQATKQVVKNIPLSGIKRLNMFKADDGTLYIHMMLGSDDYTKFLQNSKKTFDKRLAKIDASRENINKAEVATQKIFSELESERLDSAK